MVNLPSTVATISKQMSWLFWKSLTKGNARRGKKSTSPNIGDQWANDDSALKDRGVSKNKSPTACVWWFSFVSYKWPCQNINNFSLKLISFYFTVVRVQICLSGNREFEVEKDETCHIFVFSFFIYTCWKNWLYAPSGTH